MSKKVKTNSNKNQSPLRNKISITIMKILRKIGIIGVIKHPL